MSIFTQTRPDTLVDRHASRLPTALRRSLVGCALVVAAATMVSSLLQSDLFASLAVSQFWLTNYFFQTQDLWLLVATILIWLGLADLPLSLVSIPPATFINRRPMLVVVGLAVGVFVVGLIGMQLVFHGYHGSRDEVMADFDATIFAAGKFIAPIDPSWQAFAGALQPRFILPVGQSAGFVSAYLPVNAALRTLVGLVSSRDWTSPILAALSIIATYGVGRRLWPARPGVALLSALSLTTSSQLLVTAMTSYAMTAHLALNMVWLWLFLRDDRRGHAGALIVGFFACGLHQLIFHPLFVAPFILRLWTSHRRRLAMIYVLAYAGIGLFWILFWQLALQWAGMAPASADDVGSTYFMARVLVMLASFDVAGIDLMLKNILRFVAWQGPALLPLAVLAYPALKRGNGIARELLAGLLLTIAAMFVLLPYQGHGWGYRYLHGLLGSLALLAGYGWVCLSERMSQTERGAARVFVALTSAIACLVLLPVHAMQARGFVTPYRQVFDVIRQSPADVVIVDETNMLFGEDLVRNDPFLRNRPKVLDLSNLTEANIAALCAAHMRIAVFDAAQARAQGIMPGDRKTGAERRAKLRALLNRSCPTESVLKINAPLP